MKRLTASDSLWLAILERNPDLAGRPATEVRRVLKASGFPAALIQAFLRRRTEKPSAKTG